MRSFVGRRPEIRRVWDALSKGRHVVLEGPYGMGRTALIRQVAECRGGEIPFVFADLSGTSGQVSRRLYGFLAGNSGRTAAALSCRTIRYRLFNRVAQRIDPCVIVLDNIERLTRSRLRLVSDLAGAPCFRVVAIVRAGLPAGDRDALRRCLDAPERIDLGWLRPRDVRDFLRDASAFYGFGWDENEIETRARALGGYPLGIMAAIDDVRRRLSAPDVPGAGP